MKCLEGLKNVLQIQYFFQMLISLSKEIFWWTFWRADFFRKAVNARNRMLAIAARLNKEERVSK